jgi:lipoate-protein ligase A
VAQLTCRLLPFTCADGPHNMAADMALLQTATAGTASLRFYGWSDPTASLGYFQQACVRLEDPNIAALPFVRRPSGGATLVHDRELTYCLTLPAGRAWQGGSSWLERMHRILADALAELGIASQLHEGNVGGPHRSFLCFHQLTRGDVLIGSAKVAGSAQRKQRGALLQHGALLLAASPHTHWLPGIENLTGMALGTSQARDVIRHVFERSVPVTLIEEAWTAAELQVTDDLASRYLGAAWNLKR